LAENWQRAGFGIYLHWPFCQAKCPYCDFNSHVWTHVDQDEWSRAFLREIDAIAERVPDRVVSTVFFGGGTPSLMKAETVDRILAKIRSVWPIANTLEVTLEANPTSVEAQRFAEYKDAGVNRVSIGVQALNDDDLKRLGRLHSVDEALKAIEIARDHFERMSFDLIYARQDQNLENWHFELEQCLNLRPDHVSLYQLTIEEGTAFGALHSAGKLRGLPDEDFGADMFELTQDVMSKAGLGAYEISNHANTKNQALHNLIYWRGGDWVGIGPGAHGRFTVNNQRFASETDLDPRKWLSKTLSGEATRISPITTEDAAIEYLMMSLRLREGTDMRHLQSLDPALSKKIDIKLQTEGLPLAVSDGSLQVLPGKQILLNSILLQLV